MIHNILHTVLAMHSYYVGNVGIYILKLLGKRHKIDAKCPPVRAPNYIFNPFVPFQSGKRS